MVTEAAGRCQFWFDARGAMDLVVLSAVETRVLGALIEKDVTTPDYYPLSLNALVNACNQKNNRDPVMNLEEEAVRQALLSLEQNRLASPARGADSRVTKYEHRLQEVFNFTRGEMAIVCVLLLRGPETPGELRGRCERMHRFAEVADVQSTLQRLMQRDPALVKVLPRRPGTKEPRYAHLLSPVADQNEPGAGGGTAASSGDAHPRIARLENEVAELRQAVQKLSLQLADFRKQFE